MMTRTKTLTSDPVLESEDAAGAVAAAAKRWELWANVVIGATAVFLFGDAILQPVLWSLSSSGWYPLEVAMIHTRDNVLAAAPGYALFGALIETRLYLARLSNGAVWLDSTQNVLARLGGWVIAAGGIGAVAHPLLDWARSGEVSFMPDLLWLSVSGVGVLIVMIARIMRAVARYAMALQREVDEIV